MHIQPRPIRLEVRATWQHSIVFIQINFLPGHMTFFLHQPPSPLSPFYHIDPPPLSHKHGRLPLSAVTKHFGKSLSASRKKEKTKKSGGGGAFHVSPHRFAARENELQINRLTSGQT